MVYIHCSSSQNQSPKAALSPLRFPYDICLHCLWISLSNGSLHLCLTKRLPNMPFPKELASLQVKIEKIPCSDLDFRMQ